MFEKSPFFARTSELCTSMRWKDWAGYYAVCSYRSCHEMEYYAFRHAAGLMDVTPLFKYEVTGPDAGAFLSYLTTRNIEKLRVGRVTYTCWCDDEGMMVDDGTVTRLAKEHFRVTAAEASLVWFERHSRGFRVHLRESTRELGALSLQGPQSREILKQCSDVDLDKMGFFRAKTGSLDGKEVVISRTGYSGDLGYEVWCKRDDALGVWDAIMDSGKSYGILPVGLDALDMVRIEAGFVMNGVDYHSSRHCIIDSRKSTPLELGLEWTVQVDRDPFVGQAALQREVRDGSKWKFVGLQMNWDEIEALYERHNLPPSLAGGAWRSPIPIYADRRASQVGYATSGTWSPILKKNLAMAHIQAPWADLGQELQIELTVEFERKTVTATVVDKPFFDPERKRG